MTKTELQELIDRVRKRHNRRVIISLVSFFSLLFGGLKLADNFFPDPSTLSNRQSFINGVVGICALLGLICLIIIFGKAKSDCYKYGVLCPKCGLNLYSQRRLLFGGPGARETGLCPHCHTQLIDNLVH